MHFAGFYSLFFGCDCFKIFLEDNLVMFSLVFDKLRDTVLVEQKEVLISILLLCLFNKLFVVGLTKVLLLNVFDIVGYKPKKALIRLKIITLA